MGAVHQKNIRWQPDETLELIRASKFLCHRPETKIRFFCSTLRAFSAPKVFRFSLGMCDSIRAFINSNKLQSHPGEYDGKIWKADEAKSF